jgi:SAM-dependent methyltransferase
MTDRAASKLANKPSEKLGKKVRAKVMRPVRSAMKTVDQLTQRVRDTHAIMPRYGFHQPFDYLLDSRLPDFDAPVRVEGEVLPLPPVRDRMGYSADDREYLNWGRYDHDLILKHIERHGGLREGMSILDFGCSSGRVLRHFHKENLERNWSLYGVDLMARPLEWVRQNFPNEFCVYTGSTLPRLPFEDNSLDVIYGISVFTHIKYQWDMWLMELRRALKPGGLLIQTLHGEHAWRHYYKHRGEDWVRQNHSAHMLSKAEMPYDLFCYGDMAVSQVFWKPGTVRRYWGRYFDVLELTPPPEKYSFQDWIICAKPVRQR